MRMTIAAIKITHPIVIKMAFITPLAEFFLAFFFMQIMAMHWQIPQFW